MGYNYLKFTTLKAPSKKIILILIACIIVVCAIYFALNPIQKRTSAQKVSSAMLEAVAANRSDIDSDNDGLQDWEEPLWGTDAKNPDSDGDGTHDGEEVRQGRNPAQASTAAAGRPANDLLSTSTISAALAKNASSSAELTATDLFAREFFTKYLELKSQGITMDANAQQKVIDETMASGNFTVAMPKKYTTVDVNAISQNDTATLHSYGNALGTAMINRTPKEKHDNEFEVFNKALTKQDEDELANMDPIIDGYTGLLKDYLEMKVPNKATVQHLALINSISVLLTDLHAMRGVFNDPITTYARLGSFPADTVALRTAMTNLLLFFNQNGVSFEQKENGYIFLHSI